MKNVLVFPCGSEIGLEIHRSINFSTHFRLFGGSSTDDHGKYVYENYISNLPFVDDPEFIEKLNKVILEYDIEYIFPAHDSVVLKLAEEVSKGNLGCRVITSPHETCDIARSKLKTYEFLQDVISVPTIYRRGEEIDQDKFPVFLKPEVGQGSKGTYLAKSLEDITFYLNNDSSLLILEYLPGSEYTIDCFTDNDGNLLFSQARERRRVSNGISVSSVEVKDARFQEIANKINDKLTFVGAWFFQLKKRANGEYALLEIAPRIAGTMGFARVTGVNLPLLSLFNAEGYALDILKNSYHIEIDRALESRYQHDISYEHVYMDFDDLIIFEGRVNTTMVAFIFQCINQGIKIHLITRHAKDLVETLSAHRLNGLFDELIWLKKGEKKSDYIAFKNSIFIDDSHTERKDVYNKRKIPVFDAHNVEALLH